MRSFGWDGRCDDIAVSAVPSQRLRRGLLAGSLGAILAISGCEDVSRARRPETVRETADWVPFRGSVSVARTWGHPGGHTYPSVDFQVASGESIRVYAAGPGTVFASGHNCPDTSPSGKHAACNGGNGNFVDIVHPDGRRSRYLHLREDSVVVEPGEHVCRGCLIGHSGWSGNVLPQGPDGAHLHYEELIGYTIVPPGPMLAQGPSGLVSFPGEGRTWEEVGLEHPLLVNRDFLPSGPRPAGSCFGWAPTLVGTEGRDVITGTRGHDVIFGGGGNDRIHGGEGEDRVCGGVGDDEVIGGKNPDRVDGGEGADFCFQGESEGVENLASGSVVSCERPIYRLTFTQDCCGSVVTSRPPGISCPGRCTQSFVTHTFVTLTATGPVSSWAGCDTSTSTTCTVTMSRDRSVRAYPRNEG
jgi:murein DD-endopeptidase MepM/ murein hydrolase activator NlpD